MTPETINHEHEEDIIEVVDNIKTTFLNFRQRTENEFKNTNNSWPACFLTDISVLNTYMQLLISWEKFPQSEEGEEILGYLFELANDINLLKKEYPTHNEKPSDEVKNSFFERFEEIGKKVLPMLE